MERTDGYRQEQGSNVLEPKGRALESAHPGVSPIHSDWAGGNIATYRQTL